MPDALHLLLALQEQDTLLDQLVHRREHHPLRAELAGLEASIHEVSARLTAAEQAAAAARARQETLEAEVSGAEERRRHLESRMYSGEVSAARDLQSMATEVEALKARQTHVEDAVLEVMEELEPLETSVRELREHLRALEAERQVRRDELTAAEVAIGEEEEAHARARRAAAAEVPDTLLERYERIRPRLGGVAAAPLINGSCGGCHLRLPATELNQLMKAPPEAVPTCEQCGRILVRP